MATANIKTTITFRHQLNRKNRITHHIGGTRSGKTYALLQYLITKGLDNRLDISIVRKTIPSLKKTVMKDFKDIMESIGLWDDSRLNISDRVYTLENGTNFNFVNTDDEQKLRGYKSDLLYIDEANEIEEDAWFQLMIRTTGEIILSYNPTISPYHYLRKMENCDRFVTTYKNNPFLNKEQIKAIEDLQYTNTKYFQIYGLGEYASNDKAIFDFEIIDTIGEPNFIGFGLDFGYASDPTALCAVYRMDDSIILEELIYEKGLVTSDIVERLKKLDIQKSEEIWADSAEPRLIEELYRSGFNIKPVVKGKDSINFGINVMKNYKIKLLKQSQNLINEMYGYEWATDKNGIVLDRPQGGLDHLIDAARYCCMMKLSQKAVNKGNYTISIH